MLKSGEFTELDLSSLPRDTNLAEMSPLSVEETFKWLLENIHTLYADNPSEAPNEPSQEGGVGWEY